MKYASRLNKLLAADLLHDISKLIVFNKMLRFNAILVWSNNMSLSCFNCSKMQEFRNSKTEMKNRFSFLLLSPANVVWFHRYYRYKYSNYMNSSQCFSIIEIRRTQLKCERLNNLFLSLSLWFRLQYSLILLHPPELPLPLLSILNRNGNLARNVNYVRNL